MTAAAPAAIRPHVLQRHALDALHRGVSAGGRGVVVMPCGTGKTLLGQWLAEQLAARLVVVFVPSLALIPQTVTAYRSDGAWRHRSMIVCSDEQTGRAVAIDDLDLPAWARESVTASTSARVIADFLRSGGTRVLVSTYHSAPQVAAALRLTRDCVDLVVCDEAHRLTGRPRAEFRAVLDEEQLPARRRVFLTATAVEAAAWEADLADLDDAPLHLDDAVTFGPTLYRATFEQAVAAGCLVDYDVEVLAVRGDDSSGRVGAAEAVLVAAAAGSRRMLTFHSRVWSARELAAAVDGQVVPGAGVIRAEHLEARHGAHRRAAALQRLAHPAEGDVAVIASARVLTEGVDVPGIDTVLFAEPRTSAVDIVQAVGRAMRRAPGKVRGRVVLVVTLDGDLDEDTELRSGAWRHVWVTLRSLAEMDPRFAAAVRAPRVGSRRSASLGERRHGRPQLRVDLPGGLDLRHWTLRAIDRTGSSWSTFLDTLRSWSRTSGHAHPAAEVVHDEIPIGRWVVRQRTAYRAGLLTDRQVRDLEALPRWSWSAREVAWWHGFDHWMAAHSTGDLSPGRDDRWELLDRAPAHPTHGRANADRVVHAYRSLAQFAIDTIGQRRRGELPARLAAAAEQLPHWDWRLIDDDDAAMVDALAEYAAWKGSFNPPHDYVHDGGLRLGAWVTAIRRRRHTGRLDPLLELELEQAQARQYQAQRLRWETWETAWRLAYLALDQFVRREGHCRVPWDHIEQLPDHELNLSRWCCVQRLNHRRGQLTPDRVAALDRVRGWLWEVPLRRGDRIHAVHVGDDEHGTRSAYARGCKCDDCTDANRAYEEARQRRARAGLGTTDLVDAAEARGHVRILLGRGATRPAIARAARVNKKTVTEAADGTLWRMRPETAAAILAVTIDDCWEHAGDGDRIPGGPTWRILDDLIGRGWPRAWISRELGGIGQALQLRRDWILARNARAVADLGDRVGPRVPPARRQHQPLPTLDAILAAERTAAAPIRVAS